MTKYHFLRGNQVLGSVELEESDEKSFDMLAQIAESSDSIFVPDSILADCVEIFSKASELDEKEKEEQARNKRPSYKPRFAPRRNYDDFDDFE